MKQKREGRNTKGRERERIIVACVNLLIAMNTHLYFTAKYGILFHIKISYQFKINSNSISAFNSINLFGHKI